MFSREERKNWSSPLTDLKVFFFFFLIFIGVWLLYDVVLASAEDILKCIGFTLCPQPCSISLSVPIM